jgi:hypothetical protein
MRRDLLADAMHGKRLNSFLLKPHPLGFHVSRRRKSCGCELPDLI